MALYCRKDSKAGDIDVVEAVRFEPTAPIPIWVMEFVKPWSTAGYQPRDGSWGYVQGLYNKVPVHAGDWIIKHDDGRIDVYRDSVFQQVYTPYPYEPLQGEESKAMNLEDKEVSLLDIIKDLQKRVGKLETENQILRLDAHQRLTSQDYEDIYQETMKRMNRDLRLNLGAKRV